MTDILDTIRGHIFFVTYGGGHAAALAPVAQLLRQRDVPVTILGLTTAGGYFNRMGLASLGVKDLVEHVPGYEFAVATGERLVEGRPRHSAVSAEETAAYMGVGYTALEKWAGVEDAKRLFVRSDRQAFRPVDFFVRLFEIAPPAALVGTNSPRSERAAFEAARDRGIPALCLVDLYAAFEIEWCASEKYADRICVLNDAVRDQFIERGVPPAKVTVTGNPSFDRIGRLDANALRRQYREKLGLDGDDRLLVCISQPEPERHPFSGVTGETSLPTDIERKFAAAFAHDNKVHLVFRLHPSEDRGPSVDGARLRYGTVEEPLDDILCAADCVVTCSSTVGLEAAMLGVPVVQITRSIFSADLPLAKMGYARPADTLEEAVDEIRAAFTKPHPPCPEGQFEATKRVADAIVDLVR